MLPSYKSMEVCSMMERRMTLSKNCKLHANNTKISTLDFEINKETDDEIPSWI